ARAVQVKRVGGLNIIKRFAETFACALLGDPYFLQALYGFVEESADRLVHMAIRISWEALRELSRGKVGLRDGLRASCFLGVFLFRSGIRDLLDALLQVQQALHVRIVGA